MIDKDGLFVGNAVVDSHARRAAAALRKRSHPSPSRSKGSFRWRLAWRVTDVCESTQHESRELSQLAVDDNHSSSNRSL